jgi:pimeloyl-ACP methyl ester carboxylesterase
MTGQRPRVLLLHGLLQGPAVWRDVVAALGGDSGDNGDGAVADLDVHCPDFVAQDSLGGMAEQALALCTDGPATVVGYSMGGYVALEMLARRPDAIASLVLLSTSARPETPEARERRERLVALSERDFGQVVALLVRAGLAPGRRDDPVWQARLRAGMRPDAPGPYRAHCRAVMARADHRGTLARVRVPVFVASGDGDDVVPIAFSDEMAQLAPGSLRRTISDAGHSSPIEQPQAVAALVREAIGVATARDAAQHAPFAPPGVLPP